MAMTKESLIQLGLTEDQAEGALALYADALKNYVPKEKLDETEAEKEQLTASLAERDKQLSGLKGASGASEALKKQLEEAIIKNKQDAEQAAAELSAYKKDNAINMLLIKLGAKNTKAVKALLNMDAISLDGDHVIGLQDQLTALKESDAYLFGPVIAGREPYGGERAETSAYGENPFKKETFNLTRQGELMRDNPEFAHKLKLAAGYKE